MRARRRNTEFVPLIAPCGRDTAPIELLAMVCHVVAPFARISAMIGAKFPSPTRRANAAMPANLDPRRGSQSGLT
jgi:hypothetical protein